jgi:predicted amidohydrolase YtcJ
MTSLDLALVNGAVFRADAARSWSDAVGVRNGRIVALGGPDVTAGTGAGTEVIDLEGRLLCPGFQDAHVHPIGGGLKRLGCDLLDLVHRDDGVAAVAAYAGSHRGPWVLGGGWQYHWFESGEPSAALLDELVPDRPAYLTVADGHSGWANSVALKRAGITATTPDPPDGRIVRLADGSPQGTLHEGAMDLVAPVTPPTTPADLDAALDEGQRYLMSCGITAWQDAWVTDELHAAYLRAAADGRLLASVRGAGWWSRTGGREQLDAFRRRRDEAAGRYAATSVKLMLDGVCENFTARMLEPYLDASGTPTANRGTDMLDPDSLPEVVTAIVGAGFQPHFHAIGDAAVRLALDAVETARRIHGWTDVRPHISHIQVIHPDDVPRFRRLGVVANAQARWACAEEAMTEMTIPFLGPERSAWQYRFGDLLRAGATLAMGSDWSVSTANVMEQIAVAVTRRHRRDVAPFLPDQAIGLADALVAFTAGSAHVNGLERDRGTISPGAAADLVVLDADPFETDDIAAVGVDLTLIDGGVVFERT